MENEEQIILGGLPLGEVNIEEPETVDTVMQELQAVVQNRQTRKPEWYIDMAMKLVILSDDLIKELGEKEAEVNKKRKEFLIVHEVASKAEIYVKAESIYAETKTLERKLKNVEEFIKLAKKQASFTNYQ